MKHKTKVEVEGLLLSPRFLKRVDGVWLRQCRHCQALLSPISNNFHLKGTPTCRILDRTCCKCRDRLNNAGGLRTCSLCLDKKEATADNFMVNRGVLLRICKECASTRILAATKRWQERNPRRVWEAKVKGDAKRRATKKGIPYDEAAVSAMVASHVDGAACPCCHKPMSGKKRWASLDRIDSSRGYEDGNMSFICYRCNFVKSNGTLQELQGIVAYMVSRLIQSTASMRTVSGAQPQVG